MSYLNIKIQLVSKYNDLPLPYYATELSAGMDLIACIEESILIKAGEYQLIATGIFMELPKGYEAQIRPRSGLALKHGITVLNSPGTIDADYRGEIKVILINHSKTDFLIKRGERIAQMVIASVATAKLELVESLEDSSRGSGGFGSTGQSTISIV